MKAMMMPAEEMPEGGKGVIAWSQCKDPAGVWTFDTKHSSYTPDPIKRRSTLDLKLVGSETKDIHVDHYDVIAYLNGHQLTTMTKPGGDYHNTWNYEFTQDIPFITPPGTYKVQVHAMGNVKTEEGDWQYASPSLIGCAEGTVAI